MSDEPAVRVEGTGPVAEVVPNRPDREGFAAFRQRRTPAFTGR